MLWKKILNFPGTRGGFTMMEVVVAGAITAIILPSILLMFNQTNRGFSGYEATSSLKTANENTVNRMYLRLGRCKRIFQNDSMGASMLSNLVMSGAPVAMSGSQLPIINQAGSLSPGATNYVAADFGNSLLMAYNSDTAVLNNVSTSASTTSTCTVRVDLYKFAYYYLTATKSPVISGKQTYKATEWESAAYADCGQLTAISTSRKISQAIIATYNTGVSYCWNSSATAYNVSFSSLVVTGSGSSMVGSIASAPAHKVQQNSVKTLTKVMMGIMGSAYQYGVAPNTADMSGIFHPVPRFATVSGAYPGGFEVGVVGPTAGRKVLVRSVLYATGAMNHPITDEKLIIAVARDIW